MLALIAVSVGGYIASHVHVSRPSLELLNIHGHLPYYGIMYYGAIGQAAFGSLMIIFSIVMLFL